MNAESLFDNLQKKVHEQSESTQTPSTYKNDENILKLKPGQYSLRLLWLPPAGSSKREYPMINQYIHQYWDEHAIGDKRKTVICPTSEYIKGENTSGFSSCPICAEVSKLYKDFKENGSSSAEALYKIFRRTLRGYVPVYVINGPEDVIGKVKILQYTKQFKDFFDMKIFGVMPKSIKKDDEQQIVLNPDDIIGIEAFMYERDNEIITRGYNLNINVITKRMMINNKSVDMPKYNLEFSRKQNTISDIDGNEITVEFFNSINDTLSFDEKFYHESSVSELTEFAVKYLSPSTVISNEDNNEKEADDIISNVVNKTSSIETKQEVKIKPILSKTSKKNDELIDENEEEMDKIPINSKTQKQKEETESEEESQSNSDDDDFDVDALIDSL